MKIIPVIDLKDGIVVSAQQGKRNTYQAIKSKLCATSSISDVINGFLSVYPFKIFYIADLNGITNTGNNKLIINKVISENLNIEFWIDNGKKVQNILADSYINHRLVIGSENQNISNFNGFKQNLKNNILSLDFFPDQGYTGPNELIENSDLWPQEIIIMTLDRVGNNAGPDFEKLKGFCKNNPGKNFIAAGGIRDETDLLNLKEINVNSALVASALHSGKINIECIKKLISIL